MARIANILPDPSPGGAKRLHLDLAREWLALVMAVEFVLCSAEVLDGSRYGWLVAIGDVTAFAEALRAARAREYLASTIACRYLAALGLGAAA